MNKGELVDKVAEKANVTKKQADSILSAALESIVEAVGIEDQRSIKMYPIMPISTTARLSNRMALARRFRMAIQIGTYDSYDYARMFAHYIADRLICEIRHFLRCWWLLHLAR